MDVGDGVCRHQFARCCAKISVWLRDDTGADTRPPLTDHLAIGPGDVLELRLGEFDARGETASEIDGAPAAVTGGIPGELVRAEVVKVFPSAWFYKLWT